MNVRKTDASLKAAQALREALRKKGCLARVEIYIDILDYRQSILGHQHTMQRLRSILLASSSVAILVSALGAVSGCNDNGPKKPTLYPVAGELFVKGQPASGAKVILQPVDNADPAAWPAGYPRAIVGPEGRFDIESYDPKDGAPAGKYKVIANWLSGEDGQEEDANAKPRVNQMDAKYNNAASTPWEIEVKPDSDSKGKPQQFPRFNAP